MSFSDPSTTRPLSKNNVPPVGTKGREQGSSAFKHIPAEEQDPSRPGNIHTNPISIAADSGDRTGQHPVKLFARETLTEDTDHAQCHRGTGDQSQFTWEDVSGTGWGPEFYPEREIPGSPTELNSPTRYEVYTSPLEFQATHRRSSRARTLTRKAQEIKNMELSFRKVIGSSHKIRKKPPKRSKPLRQDNDVVKLVPETSSSPMPSRNKFLDSDGDLILPTVQELCGMTDSDKEEWQRAIFASGD